LIFMSTYSPDFEVRLILFNVKLRYIGLAFVLIDIIQIPYGNAGGHLAHLGGAGLGFFYVQRLNQGTDIGLPFERFIDSVLKLFQRNSSLKTVYKNTSNKKSSDRSSKKDADLQHRIDEILDKISSSGYESLSKDEKDFLFRAGKK